MWKRIHDEHESLETQLKHLDTVIQSLNKNEQECKKKINDKQKEIQKSRDALNQLENDIDLTEDGFVDKRIQEHQRRCKLVRKRTEVEEMERLLAAMAPMDESRSAEEIYATDMIDLTLHEDHDEEESDCELKCAVYDICTHLVQQIVMDVLSSFVASEWKSFMFLYIPAALLGILPDNITIPKAALL